MEEVGETPGETSYLLLRREGWLLLPPRLAVPHQFQRLLLFFQQHHVTWLSPA